MTTRIITGDCRAVLASLPAESVHCCVTSPPYYGLRDYGIEPQVWGGDAAGCDHEWGDDIAGKSQSGGIASFQTNNAGSFHSGEASAFCRHCTAWRGSLGLEPTPVLFVEHTVAVFREVRRVLRRDGTLWLNIGDSYASSPAGNKSQTEFALTKGGQYRSDNYRQDVNRVFSCKPKDLLGIPWMLAFALRDDGWYLRSEITWAKRSPMPESVTDRPTSATEKVFLLAKSARYFYDAEGVAESATPGRRPCRRPPEERSTKYNSQEKHETKRGLPAASNAEWPQRNMRNWWLLGPEPFAAAHFATFPTEIPRRAILAGCPPRGTVLDPFFGAGTTGLVADQLQRHCIGIELNPAYAAMAERRVREDCPLFAEIAAE